ncbi:hypothetical protein QR680_017897 [Steinernema hermaphroditum]|uniref:Uncharacterized protein n=1 Tax=Steinernema hermaphroditum TaxID=289476 RepID=A0AA39HHH1_9BILA|nr:hypothetical protein QR680_017897 [Steinernema hermaphroditum]
MDRKAVESLKEKDLFVHIGDAELRAAFPAENPTIAALYNDRRNDVDATPEGMKEKKTSVESTRAALKDILAEKQAAVDDLQNCLSRDNRTIQELETYFKKLTKRVFDKQSEFDKMRVGKLPVRNASINKISLVDPTGTNISKNTMEAHRNKNLGISAMLDRQLEETSRQASVLEEKWFQLQDELSDAQNALAFEQAKVKEKNLKKHRIQVAETLGRLEPKPTMYKRYLSAESIDKKGSAMRTDQLVKRKDVQLKQNLSKLKELNAEIESLKLQIEEARRARGQSPSSPSSEASSTRSRLSLPKIALNEADKKTKKIIDEHTKEALKELKKEKQQLEANIGLISTQVQNVEKEIHKSYQQKEENIAKIQQKMEEIEELLTKRDEFDRKRSRLLGEMEQAKVDEANLRNKYKTMSSLRADARLDAKEYYEIKQRHSQWLERVNEARDALDMILRLQKAANLQNQIAKNDLSTVKPYFDEYAEYEALLREQKELTAKLKRSNSDGNIDREEFEDH